MYKKIALIIFCTLSLSCGQSLRERFNKNQPTKITAHVAPWQLTANGDWRTLANIFYLNANDQFIEFHGGKLKLETAPAESIQLPGWAGAGAPVTLILNQAQSTIMQIISRAPKLPSIDVPLPAPADDLAHFQVVANNIGPYANAIGWTPLNEKMPVAEYAISRITDQEKKYLTTLPATAHNYFDHDSLIPEQSYRYQVDVLDKNHNVIASSDSSSTTTQAKLPEVTIDNFNGKGGLITTKPRSKAPYAMPRTPEQIITQAVQQQFNFLEVQVQYGDANKLSENPTFARWFDTLLIRAHEHHIKIIAWIVARNPSVTEEKKIIQTLGKRPSAQGEYVDGVALDVEPDKTYMGEEKFFASRSSRLIHELKQAMGNYPLTVIIPKPMNYAPFPAAAIRDDVALVAPMLFWHASKAGPTYSTTYVSNYCKKFLSRTQALFGPHMPIGVVLQSASLAEISQEKPSDKEIAVATHTATQMGVKSIAYFKMA